jgi:aryl carrier-like protein
LRRTGVRLSVSELAAEPTLAAWHRYANSAAPAPARAEPTG